MGELWKLGITARLKRIYVAMAAIMYMGYRRTRDAKLRLEHSQAKPSSFIKHSQHNYTPTG